MKSTLVDPGEPIPEPLMTTPALEALITLLISLLNVLVPPVSAIISIPGLAVLPVLQKVTLEL